MDTRRRHHGALPKRSFLVVAPNWVGDMVMAQSLLRLLMQRYQDSTITMLAPEWTRPLSDRMPEIAESIGFASRHGRLDLWRRLRAGRALRGRGFTNAIVLPNSFKSALIPFWARIPVRTGYRGEMRVGLLNDIRAPSTDGRAMTVRQFAALGMPPGTMLPETLPLPRLAVTRAASEHALARLGLRHPDGRLLALCPGAEYGPAKRWPVEHFAALARAVGGRGWTVWLFGSSRDRAQTEAIQAQADGACIDLAGRTKLDEAIDLLALADAVVTNDSGLMHVAAALERPVIALFGSSSAALTPPLGDHAKVLSLDLPCAPCFARECPLGHLDCLRSLLPERVLSVLDTLQ